VPATKSKRRALPVAAWLVLALLFAAGAATEVRAQTPAIQIAGATAATPLPLTLGCNVIVAETAAGTPISAIASLVKPADALISIWRYDNTAKVFRVGFFADRSAPVDFSTTGSSGQGQMAEAYYLCLRAAATIAPP
jgi:hypothetical protein